MKKYLHWEILFAFAATTLLAFFSISKGIELTSYVEWQKYSIWLALALLIGLAVQYLPYRKAYTVEKDREKLRSEIFPIVMQSLDDTLRRRKRDLGLKLQHDESFELYAFYAEEGKLRVLGSSEPEGADTRQIVIEGETGVVGYCYTHKSTFILASPDGKDIALEGKIFNSRGEYLAEQSPLPRSELNRCKQGLSAIIATPIRSKTADRHEETVEVIGVLTLDGLYAGAFKDFASDKFRAEIQNIALDVAPFILAKVFVINRTRT